MRVTIKARLLVCLSALALVIVSSLAVGGVQLHLANTRLHGIVADRVKPLEQLKKVSDAYAINVVDTAHKTRAGDLTPAQAIQNITSAQREVSAEWSAYLATQLTPEEAALAQEAKGRLPLAEAATARLRTLIETGDAASLAAFNDEELYPAIDPFTETVGKLVTLQVDVAKAAGETSSQAYGQAMAIFALLAAIAAGVLGFSLLTVLRQVLAPILGMTSAMQKLAKGDHHAAVPSVGRADEVGRMADAVQHFKDAAIEKLRLEEATVAGRSSAEAERQRTEAERAEAAQQQALVVAGIAEGLGKLAKGELTYRLTTPFSQEYEALRTDFNAAIEALQNVIKGVRGAAGGIRTGAEEISEAANDLSRRTEQQAASLEETAAALDEITATVARTADGARHALSAVSGARLDAERSGEVVGQAVSAMTGLEQSSREIEQITGVIDEIAFQTNLLALNAGVEAARAGAAGAGFAVVASEVRALAQRAATAAKEIKVLISSSTGQVGEGVKLVRRTGEALHRIVAQVSEIDAIVAGIAASAEEQSSGLSEVNTAVNHMDQVTQQNAAMVEQSTAASHGLAREAGQLAQLMERFRVEEAGQDLPTVQPSRPAPAPARRPAPAPPLATRGSAAVALDEWEEF